MKRLLAVALLSLGCTLAAPGPEISGEIVNREQFRQIDGEIAYTLTVTFRLRDHTETRRYVVSRMMFFRMGDESEGCLHQTATGNVLEPCRR